jgi:SNF2 family DNA or RNA helicase
MLELEGHELEVVNVLAMIVKLHQIVCGQLKVGDDEYISIENERLDTLVELLEDFNGKAIIWATYRQTIVDVIKLLQEKFGRESTVGYWGGVKDKERAENVEAFKHGKARFIVANPAMGFGNTWTEATLVIYYSNSYNLEHRLQSEDRAHRIGQTRSVTYVDFITPGTVDERIVEVLRTKKKMSDLIMDRPLKEWL